MALLDITGLDPHLGHFVANRYCAVTTQVLKGFERLGETHDPELNTHLRIYMESGREKDSLGMRAPLVFWLVLCGWVTPQRVLDCMSGAGMGSVGEDDLARLFTDRWILEGMLEHWGRGTEYVLLPAVPTPHHSFSPVMKTDAFTAAATNQAQKEGAINALNVQQLTNEPALPALLARPQVFRPVPDGFLGPGESRIVSLRWRSLVKQSLKTLVEKRAGPITARAVFEGISKGLCYFEQERRR